MGGIAIVVPVASEAADSSRQPPKHSKNTILRAGLIHPLSTKSPAFEPHGAVDKAWISPELKTSN